MDWQFTPYTPFLLITSFACLVLTAFVFRRRRSTGSMAATGLFAAISGWNLAYAFELSCSNLPAQMLWANVEYIFIPVVPVLWFVFTIQFTGRGRWLPRWLIALLFIEPAMVIFLAWGSEIYPYLRVGANQIDVGGSILVEWQYGTFFWIHTAYAYVMMLLGTFMLVPVILRSPFLYKAQAFFVLVGTLAPWIANAIYLSGLSPFPHLDLTPFAFSLVSIAVAFGLLRLHFLDVVPVARDMVVEGLWEGVIVIGINGLIIDVNRAAEKILRRNAGELIGRDLLSTVPEVTLGNLDAEQELVVGDGDERRTYEVLQSPVHDRRGERRGDLIVLHDLTLRKEAEEERVRAQRLGAAHELASGISHNLNNILIGIMAPAQRLRDGESSDLRRDADIIVAAAQRAQDLVARLSRSGRSDHAEPTQAVDVNAVLLEAVEAARSRWQDEAVRRGVIIDLQTDLGIVPLAKADPTGLHDIFVNLIFNSVDAMPAGGQLSLSTLAADESSLLITVSDDGAGMDEAVQRRIFEPFFTTKVDVGSGLGLATAYRAIRDWGGDVSVDSQPGAGTTFRIRIPAWDGPPPVEITTVEAVPDEHAGRRILIAEDEGIVAMVLEDCVRRLGYHPDVIDRGDLALERLRSGRYGVAILDLGIPGLTGDEVARQAKLDCDLTTVLMTGWSLAPQDPRLESFDLSLQKPFDAREAEAMIARAIDLQQGESQTP
ncbi:MAG: PAS domain-containing protein [Gemmatimonadetes bacterium]|jgi:PAS domain S-box-containing protein|nr:PAS domain-containing protein [Gemmatimonadota bacterium]MBT4612040.1 PAS domain-containing protein [Gemmatimonadota bacterium]MBT5143047.1 PAS domain-containing protein [Gemmatimonadota bacterium]MBT5588313.1 PAS domain-containing protein [Gemmatimonadota bacterium]MBT5962712.1 PAS domain-containing protein [Gemmatimonadota bacterium]